MSLATTYDGKLRVINDILNKMSPDEKRIVLQSLIKEDMKTYFEVIWDEQKRLETEAGVEGVCEFTSDKAWVDGDEDKTFDDIEGSKDSGIEINLAGKVSKEAENAYYLDEKIDKKQGNDKFDGFLGYVNSSASDDNEKELETEQETILEPGEFMDKVMDKIEDRIQEIEMKNKMKNAKFPDFGGDNK